ncbi:hypothetical protein CHARACLAT_008101 [Characodon lateralis]|uniref:Secreted protein n=1 Tax=Characodon lateralis TaxID=208331 RepID=A0ABU7CVY3_9TELE|nr:hypothetical protein [Characodon lateralis]
MFPPPQIILYLVAAVFGKLFCNGEKHAKKYRVPTQPRKIWKTMEKTEKNVISQNVPCYIVKRFYSFIPLVLSASVCLSSISPSIHPSVCPTIHPSGPDPSVHTSFQKKNLFHCNFSYQNVDQFASLLGMFFYPF